MDFWACFWVLQRIFKFPAKTCSAEKQPDQLGLSPVVARAGDSSPLHSPLWTRATKAVNKETFLTFWACQWISNHKASAWELPIVAALSRSIQLCWKRYDNWLGCTRINHWAYSALSPFKTGRQSSTYLMIWPDSERFYAYGERRGGNLSRKCQKPSSGTKKTNMDLIFTLFAGKDFPWDVSRLLPRG